MATSKLKHLSVPTIAIIAVTRGALGFGAGLLLADKLRRDSRKTIGWSLLLSGLLSTIPIALYVLDKGSSTEA